MGHSLTQEKNVDIENERKRQKDEKLEFGVGHFYGYVLEEGPSFSHKGASS